ncbi:MAG: DUF2817 domain-containing protein [Lentisphaerae bacterium]|jgi:hypothetical protein|nr:DUF2817 domain-containing protein [Lentisphaerota bacterium]MBT4817099.1 DUF2817 domain-containing protein [Lentisphaerota bacterium]MBT5613028.1 DUF2817 domain-containing protein [Lentisphaerota bacterium]MBT7056726.1 DUF2817 domain-containing protein [Lentisphaerota bacterium]MBT7843756.1 DUF2817 domain-containing protein [Lentisphaerota bacterium]
MIDGNILFLSDSPNGAMGQDLKLLYPERLVARAIAEGPPSAIELADYGCIITAVCDGTHLAQLDYNAIEAYAQAGGTVVSCLFEYAAHRGLNFSKTHVGDRFRPALRIEAEGDITRGYAVGDTVWWYGCVSSAPDMLYSNQMLQRQILDISETDGVQVLATSTVNGGAVMVHETIGDGQILALDLLSPLRPFYNSYGSTNKYVFLGNLINNTVRHGRHYPKRLSYDAFVKEMYALEQVSTGLNLCCEGPCSDGRDMWSFEIGDPANPTIYIGAAVHGWEWENAYGLLRFAELITQQPELEGLDTSRFHFRIMPVQNPYGFDQFTRQNARGVDLNRNFDCHWDQLPVVQDVAVPWDYNYKGTRPASEPETQAIQRIFDAHQPMAVIDFHTADYIMLTAHCGDRELLGSIHQDIQDRLKDRYISQKPYGGAYQQVNMERTQATDPPQPYLICYAAEHGTPASFLIEMSGNRDDAHALLMNSDTVVDICLAAVAQCAAKAPQQHGCCCQTQGPEGHGCCRREE